MINLDNRKILSYNNLKRYDHLDLVFSGRANGDQSCTKRIN